MQVGFIVNTVNKEHILLRDQPNAKNVNQELLQMNLNQVQDAFPARLDNIPLMELPAEM